MLNDYASKARREHGENISTRLNYRTLRINNEFFQVENGKIIQVGKKTQAVRVQRGHVVNGPTHRSSFTSAPNRAVCSTPFYDANSDPGPSGRGLKRNTKDADISPVSVEEADRRAKKNVRGRSPERVDNMNVSFSSTVEEIEQPSRWMVNRNRSTEDLQDDDGGLSKIKLVRNN